MFITEFIFKFEVPIRNLENCLDYINAIILEWDCVRMSRQGGLVVVIGGVG